jgi:Flp pilus assembly protein CpaB
MSSKVLFGVAVALSLLAFLLVRSEVQRASQVQALAGPMATVAVATHDLAAGATLGPADVRVTQLPVIYVPPGAVASTEAAIGLVSSGPVRSGEVLVSTRLAASAFGPSLAAGYVAVTIGFASVPAGLTPADRADAYATYAGARPYTTQVGEDLHILSISQATSSFDGPGSTLVTLDVDPETARQLLQAAATGTLGLAARAGVTPSASASASPVAGAAVAPG